MCPTMGQKGGSGYTSMVPWQVHGGTILPPWCHQSGKGRSGQLELAHARAHFVNAI
jgi:hypothetical protein